MGSNEDFEEVLAFWFAEETKPYWYESTPTFDALCKRKFGELHERAAAGALDGWQDHADGALALCILLDQIPRNIHRGRPAAFATDPKAIAVAKKALENGLDQELSVEGRQFLYLPFMHSENIEDQERSLELFASEGLDANRPFAIDHADIIRRFGRFPHRNQILGRASTPEEIAFLQDAKTYGQTALDDQSVQPVRSSQKNPSDQG